MTRSKKDSAARNLMDTLLEESQQEAEAREAVENDKTVDLSEVLKGSEAPDSTEVLGEPEYPQEVSEEVSFPDVPETTQGEDEKTFLFGQGKTEVSKVRIGRGAPGQVRGYAGSSATEASLAQSENLRVAQERILELEEEVERLRRENEQLLAAGETLKRRADELVSRSEKSEADLNEFSLLQREERRLMQENLSTKNREISGLKQKIEELEMRLESDLKKIRVRERELENRLELTKMEEAALVRNKDDIILDLKRRIDQLSLETENYRNRSLDLHKKIDTDQEKLRRTVRALRLALSMLEDGDGGEPLKKAE